MAKRQNSRNKDSTMGTGSGRHYHEKSVSAGWLYMLAGIVLVFAAFSTDPAFVGSLIILGIGAGLLLVGLRRVGLPGNFCCCGCCGTG